MTAVFDLHRGSSPLLISVPHDGREVPDGIRARMTDVGRKLPDTDWHVAKLYDFASELGASTLVANYSRYVVDLNRPPDDGSLYPGQLSTGICPVKTFAGEPIYRTGAGLARDEQARRIDDYWRPYHAQIAANLDELRSAHGYALLWDAHSIPSRVPSLFDGELPVLNLGSFDGTSAGPGIIDAVTAVAGNSGYEFVCDGRFKGGYITRHYGAPASGVHALQLEIAQRAYLDERSGQFDNAKADRLRGMLAAMLEAMQVAAWHGRDPAP